MSESRAFLDSLSAALKIAEDLDRSLIDVRADLRTNREETLADLRKALMGVERREAFILLGCLNTDITIELVDRLLVVALSLADTLRVRNLLGRLPDDELKKVVPNAVWRFLGSRDEGDAYRRMAELLEHLGLKEDLQDLCVRARDSIDPDIREVAEDYQLLGG